MVYAGLGGHYPDDDTEWQSSKPGDKKPDFVATGFARSISANSNDSEVQGDSGQYREITETMTKPLVAADGMLDSVLEDIAQCQLAQDHLGILRRDSDQLHEN